MKRVGVLVALALLAMLVPLASASAAGGAPGAPQNLNIAPDTRAGTGTITWSPPASPGGSPITGYELSGIPAGPFSLGADETLWDVTGLAPGTTYDVVVRAENASGLGEPATGTLRIDTWAPTTRPSLAVTLNGTTATLAITAADNPGNGTLTGWTLTHTAPGGTPASTELGPEVTTTTLAALTLGNHTFTVTPAFTADEVAGVQSSLTRTVVVVAPTKPTAPRIGKAVAGKAGGTKSATARWSAPTTGGTAITGYRLYAAKVVKGKVTKTTVKALAGSARSSAFVLPAGTYKFRVVAINKVGTSPYSAYSAVVAAR